MILNNIIVIISKILLLILFYCFHISSGDPETTIILKLPALAIYIPLTTEFPDKSSTIHLNTFK